MSGVSFSSLCLLAACSGTLVSATVHHLFVGSVEGVALVYGLEFDDKASTLKLAKSNAVEAAHPWITLGKDKKSLYAVDAAKNSFFSYKFLDGATVELMNEMSSFDGCKSSHIARLPCINNSLGTGNPHTTVILASPDGPFAYGAGPASRGGTVVGTMPTDGVQMLDYIAHNYSYSSESTIRSLSFSPNARFLYSADVTGNAIWIHNIDPDSGAAVFFYREDAGSDSSGNYKRRPVQVAAHRMGRYLYVVMQETNELVAYELDWYKGHTKWIASHGLLPEGTNATDYVSTSLAISNDGTFLWTTTSSGSKDVGYVSVFAIEAATGLLTKKLTTQKTAGGGSSHSLSAPPSFSNTLVALTYFPSGNVEVWQVQEADATAGPAANFVIGKGCCGNAVWLD